MKKGKNTLVCITILLIGLTLSSCGFFKSAAKIEPVPVIISCPPIVCPQPDKPVLQKLSPEGTKVVNDKICLPTEEFVKILENMNDVTKYTKELESTINCYKDSLKPK